jgi:hypothetical protein
MPNSSQRSGKLIARDIALASDAAVARRPKFLGPLESGVDQTANPLLALLIGRISQITIEAHQFEADIVIKHEAQSKPDKNPAVALGL